MRNILAESKGEIEHWSHHATQDRQQDRSQVSVCWPGFGISMKCSLPDLSSPCREADPDNHYGHTGKNFLAYSPDDNRWHGLFADNQGRVHIFEGKIENGSAEFTGPSRGPNGETILNRIKVRRVSDTQVQQSWEKSTDNGATWALEFRGEYSRQNP